MKSVFLYGALIIIYRDKLYKMVSNTGDIVLDSKLCVWQIKVSVWSVRSDLSFVWEGNYNVCTLKKVFIGFILI